MDGILPRNGNRNKTSAKGRDSSFSRQTKDDKIITRKLKPVHEAQHMFHTEHIVHIANVRVTSSKTVTFVNTMAGMQVIKEQSQNRHMQLLLRQIANVTLYQLLQSPLPMTTKVTNVVINSMKMLHTT